MQHVESFVFNTWRFKTAIRTVFPALDRKSWPAHFAPKTIEELVKALSYRSYHGSKRAEDLLIASDVQRVHEGDLRADPALQVQGIR